MSPLLPLPAPSEAHCHLSLSHFSELSFPLQLFSHAVPCCPVGWVSEGVSLRPQRKLPQAEPRELLLW